MKINKYAIYLKYKGIEFPCMLVFCLYLPIQISYSIHRSEHWCDKTTHDHRTLYKFKHKIYNVTIPENSVGKIYAKAVLHQDVAGIIIPFNEDVQFRIISGDRDKIFKPEKRIVGNRAFVSIRTRTSNVVLNREKTEEYLLQIRAFIKTSEKYKYTTLETETLMHIKVLDRNDLSPFFYPTEYAISIPEDTIKHQSVLKVFADDADQGINGEIYYSFSIDNDYFSIHPTTGVITLIKQLKYDDISHFEFIVLANDRGSIEPHYSHLASKAKVKIFVKQVNSFAPEIVVKTFSSINVHTAPLVCAIIKIYDKDLGPNGELAKLEITDGDPNQIFHITKADNNSKEYYIEIKNITELSNVNNLYNLTLRAEDKGTPPRFNYKVVPIIIAPEKKNFPVFTKMVFEVSIPETSPPNMPVIRLRVNDSDLNKQSLVSLEIVGGNEGGEFKINADSGMLYTQKPLDAEKKAFYILTVIAFDKASIEVRKQSTTKVKIYILDMNDNDPVFENLNKMIYINENEAVGTYVAQLTATDKDSGENAYISYSIANINEVPFEIDHFTGVIKTTEIIDYETMRRNYTIIVRASDWGLPFRRQTEIVLIVSVKNVNDNRPMFERVDCIGNVQRNTPVGTDIFTFSAIDFDASDYILYRIISGNKDGCFSLELTTGILSISCSLKKTSLEKTVLKISASDGTHFSDELSINIKIFQNEDCFDAVNAFGTFECRETGVTRYLTEFLAAADKNNAESIETAIVNNFGLTPSRYGENLHVPEFFEFPEEVALFENVQLGESVTWIQARDRDLGYNGKLVFTISDGDNDSAFRIDPESGELQIIGYLDRERQEKYFLNITVNDLGQPKKYNSKALKVIILDSNDNAPIFTQYLTSFWLKENTKIGTVIQCVNATDADIGRNGEVKYFLQTETNDFVLNATSGCIILSNSLDREKQENYELYISATDGALSPLSTTVIINIAIVDINDNAPIFGAQKYIFKIREDIPRGTVVASIEATDLDIGLNSYILFSLQDLHNDSTFKIDQQTGAIRTQAFLDYEIKQVHNLIVTAIDCGSPALSSSMPIFIEVIDVNENRYAPEFEDFVYAGKLRENKPKGSIILNITAKDLDIRGPDSKITYSITGGDGLGLFAVNKEGTIKSLSHFDAETKNFFWLTLCASDNAIVPLSDCVEVFIEIENENDNTPLTDKPVYYVSASEGSTKETEIIKLVAFDCDNDPSQIISYKIISGNPEGYFQINSTTGILKTTERKLDRENRSEHILEIYISDNGFPALASTTRVIVEIVDINDHSPEFEQPFFKIQVFSTTPLNESIFQMHAIDSDVGENSRLFYSIKSGKGKNKFHIDTATGHIYIIKALESGADYEINVKAEDNGTPKRSQTARLNIVVIPNHEKSPNPPVIKQRQSSHVIDVNENDRPGFLVALIQARDDDNDQLWYNIIDGDKYNKFYIGRDNGNILLADYLDWETQSNYNLTISVTDGTHVVKTSLHIQVIDTNDNRPQFTQDVYNVNISESIEEETIIMQLHATDEDEDKKIFYHLHSSQAPSSLMLFRIDSITGNVVVTQRLDFEKTSQHILFVVAKDEGTPAKRNYAKIIINVHDHNDHYPEFVEKIIQSKVPESAVIGSKIVQITALDRDSGANAELKYSIIAGNVGNVFDIDPISGIVSLSLNLDINKMQEYILQIKVTDLGVPPLSSQLPLHIVVIMSENDPPRFLKPFLILEIFENISIGTFVTKVDVKCSSSVFFEIIGGNTHDKFRINPSTGVIVINSNIDYEMNKYFNLTVSGTNMASASSNQYIVIHILDVNDNQPYFRKLNYFGSISESAKVNSFVLSKIGLQNTPLLLNASDVDVGINGILEFNIVDESIQKFFKVDSNTGSIKLLQEIDYEEDTKFAFHVKVCDKGKPRLCSNSSAYIQISVENINDCPPVFKMNELNVTLYTPTFENIFVAQVYATDADSNDENKIRYDIIDGNTDESFKINGSSGVITTNIVSKMKNFNSLNIRASDGTYSTIMQINIYLLPVADPKFIFQRPSYNFLTVENSTNQTTIGIVNVIGNLLTENINYKILTPTRMFEIGKTSGSIKTSGLEFDREIKEKYTLIVEAKSLLDPNDIGIVRRAVVPVYVSIIDINDNCPIFVNLPYYTTVSIDDIKDTTIMQVKAIDLDTFENGEIRYKIKKNTDNLFQIDEKTGVLSLNQRIENPYRKYELLIAAYDSAINPCSTEVSVQIKVVDKSMPTFSKQFYFDSIKEDVEIYSAILPKFEANSPLKRKLIYTISSERPSDFFEIDYRTGTIYVANELDYEKNRSHELLVRATDSLTGVFSEVLLSINVIDANDCYPEIERDFYNISLAENTPFGTPIVKINATDLDDGINGQLSYFIESVNGHNTTDLFYIDNKEGTLYLRTALNFEQQSSHDIIIIVKDHGSPSLFSKTNVFLTVQDLNDNAPRFIEPSFSCKLSMSATRGHFVIVAKAYDPDLSDTNNLVYKIVDGNTYQTYSIHRTTGVIRLQNMQNFLKKLRTTLNISVTDGIYSSYARVKIALLPENGFHPVFDKSTYTASIKENEHPGFDIITVHATDKDFGLYSQITYEIVSDKVKNVFQIDSNSGLVKSIEFFDREIQAKYEVILKATDGGGKFGFAALQVTIIDVNDNSPNFKVNEIKTVVQRANKNTALLTVKAIDKDEGINANIKYMLVSQMETKVSDVVSINELNGELYVKSSLVNFQSDLIQFFIRAVDFGNPQQQNEIPVSIQIVDSELKLPEFDNMIVNVQASESTPPGTILTKVQLLGNFSAKFNIVNPSKNFILTENGEIMLSQTLDREQNDIHVLIICASTTSIPVLYAYTEVIIHVEDENDNYPKFDRTFYAVEIPESVDKGTSAVKITALDTDSGPNGDIRYYLEDETKTITSIFDIDIYSGWITLVSTLDREMQSEYNFKVLATDNGHPKHISSIPVCIKILDINDNAPLFKLANASIEAFENVLPGTVLHHIFLTDADSAKNDVDFHILSGDKHAQFQIKKNGEIFVARPLDREMIKFYHLNILVTDGKYVTETSIFVNVKDVNDNIPYCLKLRYKIQINESTPSETSIIKIETFDKDESTYSKLRFYLSGKGSEDFAIDKESGIIKVAKEIDRERQSKYKLIVHVKDGQENWQQCVSELVLTVLDINDNAPQFSMSQHIISIPEDAHLNTLLTKIHATDKDVGLNKKITYSFLNNSYKEFFSISQLTGIVYLKKSLDRETTSVYNISIKAEDEGSPKQYALINLIINVLDINDNPPEFSMKQYLAFIPEDAIIGEIVCKVLATSKDIGVNAEILYYIVSGNEQNKFKIDSKSGLLNLNEALDYEKAKSYYLSVQAVDGGTPQLSSLAYINVSVLDVNDNEPKFIQNIYRIIIKEDSSVGKKVLQVIATDKDSQNYGKIKYNIERGDRFNQFHINETSGEIFLKRFLDRETIPHYLLEVRACDSGVPQLCDYGHVNVDLLDVNDNAPIFSKNNYSIKLQENQPLGYVLAKFEIFDADDFPNNAPYTFDFREGNDSGFFRLEPDGSLCTAYIFNHKVCDQYKLQIRVFDNGTPPLYSDTWIIIHITEESQYPPIVPPLEITINSFDDDFTESFIGKIFATDQDKYEHLKYNINPTMGETYDALKLFNVAQDSGHIYAINNLDIGLYKLNVSVTDGKFTVNVIIKINVDLITHEMVRNAILINLKSISSTDFLLRYRKIFSRSLSSILQCRQKDIIIISLQDNIEKQYQNNEQAKDKLENYSEQFEKSNLSIVLAVRKQQIAPTADAYLTNEEIFKAFINNINTIEEQTSLKIVNILSTECENSRNFCVHGTCKNVVSLMKSNITTVYTDVISFVGLKFVLMSTCVCKTGYDGNICDEPINACFSDPCPPQRLCLPSISADGYQCICPTGFSGKYCEHKSTICLNENCNPNAFTSVSFNGKSYAHYKINKSMAKIAIESQLTYSLEIKTVQQTGTLLYAYGRIDYNVLEIINGVVQYKFDLGTGEGVITVPSIYISDGKWHMINLERVLNNAKLVIDNKHVSQGSAPGANGILNIQNNDVFVGAEVKPHPSIVGYEDIQRGFIGCMANIKLSSELLPLYISGGSSIAALKRFSNVEFRCDPLKSLLHLGVCGTQPCVNGGVCTDIGNNKFKCLCSSRFSGEICENDLDPCASTPCLFGGHCKYNSPNNYTCLCPLHLSGRRCEYGKFCTPNPCKNGGVCEEGDAVFHCLCRGYKGSTCEIDIDECQHQPCGNGATCVNEKGSFRCICPSYLTGASCGDPLYSNTITKQLKNFSMEHISGILSGIAFIFVTILILLCYILLKKYSSSSKRINKDKNWYIFKKSNENSLTDKRNTKINNFEIVQRPINCTSSTSDNVFPSITNFMNNLDILRSYGSAGDELENVPFEYQKKNHCASQYKNINACSISDVENNVNKKPDYTEQLHLKSFSENKFNHDQRRENTFAMNSFSSGKLIKVAMPNTCQLTYEQDYSILGQDQYHWDCSDWVRKSQSPLPDITEVPGAEIVDTSSFHSNDSNESNSKKICVTYEIDPSTSLNFLNTMIPSTEIDSDLENSIQVFQLTNACNDSFVRLTSINNSEIEDFKLSTVPFKSKQNCLNKVYLRQPDSYLCPINAASEMDEENATHATLSPTKSEHANTNENVKNFYLYHGEEMEFCASNSNISVRVCDIEDPELEEFLPQ